MRASFLLLPFVLAAPALAVSGRTAYGQAPPAAERLHVYSEYEEQTLNDVMSARHLVRDAAPEGKVVERIEIAALDVFEKRDPLPRWLNVFHVTTRRSVIRDQVLLSEGAIYQQALVDDTIRNLRRLPGVPQVSAVLVVAAAGSAPDRVVLVVITKDVWSLRLNWSLVADGGGLDQATFEPSETNFLGTHQIVGGVFVLEPSADTVGLQYFIPRLGASRVSLETYANVMFNVDSHQAEGSYGQLVAGQPLYSGKTEWAWASNVAWQDLVHRRYENASLSTYVDPANPTVPGIPFEYRTRSFSSQYDVTRSFGWDINHDFTLGANVSRNVYRTSAPAGSNPQVVADFTSQQVPVSDTRVGPALQYHTYRMRFVRVVDFDTLALQEDYRLGHDVVVRAFPSFHALGSSRDVVDVFAAAQYTWAVRDGLYRVSMSADTQPQTNRIADAYVQPTMHLVTPTVAGFGRLVLDGTFTYRWRNYLNVVGPASDGTQPGGQSPYTYLGGDDRLRGYPTNFLVGANVVSYNVELRTRPIEVLTCQLSGVAFYDVGDAYTTKYQLFQSVGVGMRGLFPWLDRTVFRFDVGFPVERFDPSTCPGPACVKIPPYGFVVSFAQAFGTPTVAPTPVLLTGQGPDSP